MPSLAFQAELCLCGLIMLFWVLLGLLTGDCHLRTLLPQGQLLPDAWKIHIRKWKWEHGCFPSIPLTLWTPQGIYAVCVKGQRENMLSPESKLHVGPCCLILHCFHSVADLTECSAVKAGWFELQPEAYEGISGQRGGTCSFCQVHCCNMSKPGKENDALFFKCLPFQWNTNCCCYFLYNPLL